MQAVTAAWCRAAARRPAGLSCLKGMGMPNRFCADQLPRTFSRVQMIHHQTNFDADKGEPTRRKRKKYFFDDILLYGGGAWVVYMGIRVVLELINNSERKKEEEANADKYAHLSVTKKTPED